MAVLLIGGAGYVGSHMVKHLLEKGEDVVILDNLATGFEDAIRGGVFCLGDAGSEETLASIFKQHKIDSVMHFAGSTLVGESVSDPAKYYLNNVSKTIALLNCMRDFGVNTMVFSSSAAVYGAPDAAKITENSTCLPINPYGRSKKIVEDILDDYRDAYGFRSYSLRYFNAAGADMQGELGERHDPETHLIPLVLQAASGRRSHISVFGRNHATPDGTCIRDYVHVEDLCELHWLALRSLRAGHKGGSYNAGNAGGYSVSQVIDAAKEVTGRAIPVADAPRRAGDPPILVADAGRAEADLGWKPNYPNLHSMIEHAWRWELQKGSKW